MPLPMRALAAISISAALLAVPAEADDAKTYALTLKDAQFTPAELKVPSGQEFMIEFTNENGAPAELESADLQIEKIAPPKSKVVVKVKALKAGSYAFVDEFQEDAAKGVVVAE